MHHYLQVLPLVAAALAVPLDQRAAAASVTIQHGTVVGSTASGVDSFKGIPYAQPPTGNLRLKPPQALTSSFGTLDAARIPKACPQFFSQVNTTNIPSDVLGTLLNTPIAQAATDTSEDCLTVNVQRPSGTTSSSKLPVVFWIFGGGFEFGSTQTYDATSLVSRSVALDEPVIYVAVNYRYEQSPSQFYYLSANMFQCQRVRLPGWQRARSRRIDEPGTPRPTSRSAVGRRQHRCLRWRSREGHHLG